MALYALTSPLQLIRSDQRFVKTFGHGGALLLNFLELSRPFDTIVHGMPLDCHSGFRLIRQWKVPVHASSSDATQTGFQKLDCQVVGLCFNATSLVNETMKFRAA